MRAGFWLGGRRTAFWCHSLTEREEPDEIFKFIAFWKRTHGQRMLIENTLSDAVRFSHMDALSSAVGLKVDFDRALLAIASGLYRTVAQEMRGHADAQARQIFRDLIDMPADITISRNEIAVSFHRRAHLPILLASGLLHQPVSVPW